MYGVLFGILKWAALRWRARSLVQALLVILGYFPDIFLQFVQIIPFSFADMCLIFLQPMIVHMQVGW